MKKKFTILITAAFMLLTMMARPVTVWGQTRDDVTDHMTASDLTATSTTYTDFSNVSLTSDAIYAGQSAKSSSGGIQLRSKNSNSGIVTTTSGGTIKSITITVESGSNTIDVYGSNNAYTAASDLYGSNQGTKIGSLSATGTITATDDYEYVGVRSNSGAVYITSIDFVWTPAGDPPTTTHSLTFSANPTEGGTVTVGGSTSGTATVSEGAVLNIVATPHTGYVFNNWTVTGTGSSAAGASAASTTFTMGTADATLTANFTQVNTYTVTYYANNGTETKNEVEYNEGDDVTIADNTFTYEAHDFTKWNTATNGTGQDYDPNDVINNIQNDINLYAQWVESSSSEVVDVLDIDFTGIAYGTGYDNWSGKVGNSGAVYSGNSAGGASTTNPSIQLRSSNNNSGIVTTTSGGNIKKVVVSWNTSTSKGRTLNIYGKNTAYSAATDLYGTNAGTLIGTIVKGTSTELTITGSYAFIGMRSANNAMYLDEIQITWEAASSEVVATPAINPNGGNFWESQEVSISCATNDATIYYTTDGTDPTNASSVYNAPFTISANTTVKAFAIKADMTDSEIATAEFTKAIPMTVAEALAATPQNGVYVSGIVSEVTEVNTSYHNATYTISDDGTNGMTVYRGRYLNNADFTSADQIQVGDVVVVYGNLSAYQEVNQLAQNNYLVSLERPVKAATPTFSPVAGTYYATQSVTIACETDGATIYYTTDGTDPTTESSVYNGAIAVNTTTTIKAFAVKEGINDSDIATAAYTIILTPSINVASNTINVGYASGNGTLEVTYENITTVVAEVNLCDEMGETATYGWFSASINQDNNVSYSVAANDGEARTAYFKVHALDNNAGDVYSEIVTVTQAAYVVDYAELPFSFTGGVNDIAGTTGLTQHGLGSDYSSSPKLKFDSTGDWVILKINERPGTLTFDIKGNSFSGGTFKVQTSADGETYSDLQTYTDLGDTQNEEFDNLGENVRYIKWIYTNKSSGNVGLGNIALAEYVAPAASITVEPASVQATAAETPGNMSITISNMTISDAVQLSADFCTSTGGNINPKPDWITDFEFQLNAGVFTGTYTIQENTASEPRTAYFHVYGLDDNGVTEAYSNVITVTQEASAAPVPTIEVTPATVQATAAETAGNMNITISNMTISDAVQLSADFCTSTGGNINPKPDWITDFEFQLNAGVFTGTYTIQENTASEPRTAYFHVYGLDDNGVTEAYSNVITVTQAGLVVDYATLPFAYDGNGTGDLPTGFTVSGLGTYSSSPAMKFDGTGDNAILKINERPGTLTFDIKGNDFSGGTFKVQTSADGETYSDLQAYTELGATQHESFNNLGENVRYIKWIYTNKSSGNVGLGNIELAEYVAPQPAITLNTYTVEATAAETEGTLTVTYTEIETSAGVEIHWFESDGETVAEEPTWIDANINSEFNVDYLIDANTGDARTAYFKVYGVDGELNDIYSNLVTVSQAAYVAPVATIHYHFNSIDNDVPVYSLGETELATPTTTINGYTFVGWTNEEISGVSESADYFMTYDVQSDIHFYAVLAIEETVEDIEVRTLTLTHENFNKTTTGSGYAAYNGEHLTDGVSYYTNQAMTYTAEQVIQMKKDEGYLYNIEPLDVNFIQLTVSAGSFTVYEGDESHPTFTEITQEGGVYTPTNPANKYFTIACGNATGKLSSIVINYNVQVPATIYTNFCTTVAEPTIPTTAGVMDDDYTIPANQAFTITDTIIIPSTVTLTINGILGNNDVTMLIIEDGGQLINNSNSQVAATVKKNIVGHNPSKDGVTGYYLISSPIDDMDPDLAGMTTGWTYDLYKFDQTQEKEWQNYKLNHFNLESGQGYLYANNDNDTLQFAGTIYNGDGKVTLTYDDKAAFAGWNLVGNPFTQDAYIDRPYYVMKEDGSEIVADEVSADHAIKPMQGIFVVTNTNGQEMTFSKTYVSTANNNGSLTLNVNQAVNTRGESRTNLVDRAIVRFGVNDMLPKFQLNDNSSKVYFTEGNKDYAVVSAEAQGEMPVYFKAAENETYTLSFSMNNVEFGYLHLIDNKTGNDVDLRQTPSYTFEASTIDYASRFRLVFRAIGNDNDSENNDFGFFDANGNFLILGIEGTATLQVMDVMGRVISNETFSGDYSKAINASAGVYMLRLIQGSDVRTQKVVVK